MDNFVTDTRKAIAESRKAVEDLGIEVGSELDRAFIGLEVAAEHHFAAYERARHTITETALRQGRLKGGPNGVELKGPDE